MTKQKVIALLKKQGADISFEEDGLDIALPDGQYWDNDEKTGWEYFAYQPGEPNAQFWADVMEKINHPIIER